MQLQLLNRKEKKKNVKCVCRQPPTLQYTRFRRVNETTLASFPKKKAKYSFFIFQPLLVEKLKRMTRSEASNIPHQRREILEPLQSGWTKRKSLC